VKKITTFGIEGIFVAAYTSRKDSPFYFISTIFQKRKNEEGSNYADYECLAK